MKENVSGCFFLNSVYIYTERTNDIRPTQSINKFLGCPK